MSARSITWTILEEPTRECFTFRGFVPGGVKIWNGGMKDVPCVDYVRPDGSEELGWEEVEDDDPRDLRVGYEIWVTFPQGTATAYFPGQDDCPINEPHGYDSLTLYRLPDRQELLVWGMVRGEIPPPCELEAGPHEPAIELYLNKKAMHDREMEEERRHHQEVEEKHFRELRGDD